MVWRPRALGLHTVYGLFLGLSYIPFYQVRVFVSSRILRQDSKSSS